MTKLFDPKRRFWRLVLTFYLAAGPLAGCASMTELGFSAQSKFGSVSLGDRCADFMRRALPDTGIEITNRTVKVDDNDTVATIEGVRRDVPPDGLYAREIAAECRFNNAILTGFRWTVGPIHPADAGQAR